MADGEKTLEESLKDPVYVNYNILKKMEDIKQLLTLIQNRQVEMIDLMSSNKDNATEGIIPSGRR